MKTSLMFVLIILLVTSSFFATAIAQTRTPVVFFPGYISTKLLVTVENQTAAPECPASGTFEAWALCDQPSIFGPTCRDKLLTLVYDRQASLQMPQRLSEQTGVTVTVKDFGKTESAPIYENLYGFLEANGYTRNLNIRVAGYDWRLTPDMGGFLKRTIALVEQTYTDNGNTPVHLVAHSNGPVYALYLLTHTTQAWKNKYIHGFTPLAGNWPGQGAMYAFLFTGFDVNDVTFPSDTTSAAISALMFQSQPATYMSAADPAVFKSKEVVFQAGSVQYTPQDYRKLFRDAGMTLAEELGPHYIGFVKFRQPPFFPNVDVYAEKGSGLDTVVGIGLPDLTVGQLIDSSTQFFFRPGDSNQEDITNDSVQAWNKMKCFRFELTDNPGIDHGSLSADPLVLGRLLTNLQRPRSVCPN